MTAAIDTSSLLSMVRYYLPFDVDNNLFDLFKNYIQKSEIVVIDKVYMECDRVSKKIVTETLSYLKDQKYKKQNALYIEKTELLLPPKQKQFYSCVQNQFVNHKVKNDKNITPAEFETQKENFLKGADAGLILYGLNFNHKNPIDEFCIVTEETSSPNDNKLFKKIPALCALNEINIKVVTLPNYLKDILNININYNF